MDGAGEGARGIAKQASCQASRGQSARRCKQRGRTLIRSSVARRYPCRLRPLLSPPPPPAAAAAAASFGRRGHRALLTPLAPRAGGAPLGRSIAIDLLLAPLVLVWHRLGLHMLPRKQKGRRPLEVMHEHRAVRRRPVRGAAPPLALPLRMACNVMHEGPDVDIVHRARRSRHHVPGARILNFCHWSVSCSGPAASATHWVTSAEVATCWRRAAEKK